MKLSTRRPLSPAQVCRARAWIAAACRENGATFRMIAQVMRLSPEEARRYVAKGQKGRP